MDMAFIDVVSTTRPAATRHAVSVCHRPQSPVQFSASLRQWTRNVSRMVRTLSLAALALALVPLFTGPVAADRLENQVAIFAALDKVTARISKLPVPLNETQQFGSLKVTPRVCFSRPPDEQPKTATTSVLVRPTSLARKWVSSLV